MNLTLTDLELMNFRNYRSQQFSFENRHVIFAGPNGVGKSNLLEAIFYLSILRSFRSATVRDMITIGERASILRATLNNRDYSQKIEVEQRLNGMRQLFIDNTPIKRSSEFINEFRAISFAPEDMHITSGSGFYRRRFFDMFIAIMERDYLHALRRYSIAVGQRNAALRNQLANAVVAAFEPEMAESAVVIATYRKLYSQKISECVNELFGNYRLEIEYSVDYPVIADDYLKKLVKERLSDKRRNFTTFGPQLDDFIFKFDGKNLRNFGSNGQHRLTALYLKMAEFTIVKGRFTKGVVALVDDVTGELDLKNRNSFFELLNQADQIFSTFTELPSNVDNFQAIHLAT